MRTFQKIMKKAKEQDGQAAVIAALVMTVLIGMSALVIDLGSSYIKASKLQNALDSAALAAVQELPAASTSDQGWQNAKTVGSEYAAANGLDNVELEPIVKNGKIRGVKASGSAAITYTFARVLGFTSGQINRTASAEAQTADGVKGLVPIAATVEQMENLKAGKIDTVYLKGGPQDAGFFGSISSGWRGFWSPDKGSFDINGYPGLILVGGDLVMTNPGVTTKAADELYEIRTKGHESCTLETYKTHCPTTPNCPRIVIVPIVKQLSNQDLEIRSFAAFFLEPAVIDSGQIKTITAKYMENYVVSSDSASGGNTNDYGVYVRKLTE